MHPCANPNPGLMCTDVRRLVTPPDVLDIGLSVAQLSAGLFSDLQLELGHNKVVLYHEHLLRSQKLAHGP